jgi:hypothetical protein
MHRGKAMERYREKLDTFKSERDALEDTLISNIQYPELRK